MSTKQGAGGDNTRLRADSPLNAKTKESQIDMQPPFELEPSTNADLDWAPEILEVLSEGAKRPLPPR
jgi:hypothetical protein